jgi:RND family efflux transporter MFP subunit
MSFVLAVLMFGCSRHASAPPPARADIRVGATVKEAGVQVKLAPLERRSLTGTIDVYGTVVTGPDAQATLSFPTDGRISTVNVNVGDRVMRGELLALLDGRVAQSAVRQAQSDVDFAEAGLARARVGARPQELAENAALVLAARTKADTMLAELEREKSLAAAGIASTREVQQAESTYADALAELRTKVQAGSLLAAGPRSQDVDIARAQLQQSVSALSSAQTRASLTTIVAPFDGVITARMKDSGEVVDPTTPVLSLVNPNRSLVEVQLSEDQAATLQVGDRASIVQGGSTRTMLGVVDVVIPAFSPETRTLTARIRPLSAGLTPGASARAKITVRTVADGFVVDDAAVVKDPQTGEAEVFVANANQGSYTRTPVRILLQSGHVMSITGPGLHAGEKIVVAGAYELLANPGGS